ncbi:hypothetical protein AX17_004203, partial [Amanita inopinata Kibby_2008]
MFFQQVNSRNAGNGRGVKRQAESNDEEPETKSKIARIHPFFNKQYNLPAFGSTETFRWSEPLGPARSCLHGVSLQPTSSPRVAAFDLDGTLIKSELENAGSAEWHWWTSTAPTKLKELHRAGYTIVIVSNQGINAGALKKWKLKIPLIAMALAEVPFRLFAATAKDRYRKPMPGIWQELERIFRDDHVEIDKSNSFFVGDAAGRQFARNRRDFASTDRKWALNIGIKFYTPEEYFLQLPVHGNVVLPGFHVSSLPDLPLFTPTSKPLLPATVEQEVIMFVGYPCLGKTTFFRRLLEPLGYIHVNQDSLQSRTKCVKAVRDAVRNGLSCVIDNTNRDRSTRKIYVDLVREWNVRTRCFVFTGPIELAWHNNLYRAFNLPPSTVPKE